MKATQSIRLASAGVLVALIAVAAICRESLDPAALERWLAGIGPAAYPLFIAVYAAATVLFFPGAVLTLAGGALFGPVWGTVLNLTGATLGATLAFLVARYLAADWVAARSGDRLRKLIAGVEGEGWRFVAFVRLVPLFPFNLLNYALGLTRIPLLHYVVASLLCMLPAGAAYTYLGYAGREAAAGSEGLIRKGLVALALLAVVALLPRLVRRLRGGEATLDIAELHRRVGAESDLAILDVRDRVDYLGGHIHGAVNIPLPALDRRLAELDAWREHPVAVICRTDKRSRVAVAQLRHTGFHHPLLVRGGMAEWQRRGLPVEQTTAAAG